MKNLLKILLFFIIFIFYWNLGNNIENRTEAEDIYEYALMVENGKDHEWFYHKHHIMYGPFLHNIYVFLQSNNINISSLSLMRLISAFAATGTLFYFYLFCYRRYSLRPISSLLATLCFGMMYGFCRYSAEAEIPIVATFFMMSSMYYLTSNYLTSKAFLLGIFLSIVSTNIHIMNVVATYIALPAFFLLSKRYKFLCIFLTINVFALLLTYSKYDMLFELFSESGKLILIFDPSILIKGLVGFLQAIISFDFVLGFDVIRNFLGNLFSTRMLEEEFYFGSRLSLWHVLFSSITFFLLFLVTLYALLRSIYVWKNMHIYNKKFLPPNGRKSFILPIIFFVGYSLLILCVEPGNPELWVMGLMPFSLLLCGLIFIPLTYDNKLWIPFLAVILLLIHNNLAISALSDPFKDYNFSKSEYILEKAKKDDLVITAGNPVFERYLRYHSSAKVIYLYTVDINKMNDYIFSKKYENIYVLGDVFNQIESLNKRFPKKSSDINIFSKKIRKNSQLIFNNEFDGVYKLNVREDI